MKGKHVFGGLRKLRPVPTPIEARWVVEADDESIRATDAAGEVRALATAKLSRVVIDNRPRPRLL